MSYLESCSTNKPLLANEIYTSRKVKIDPKFITLQISVLTSLGGVLKVYHSHDGIQYDTYGDEIIISSATHRQFSIKGVYLYVEYTNGEQDLTQFNLVSKLSDQPREEAGYISGITYQNSLCFARTPNNSVSEMKIDASGKLLCDIGEISTNVSGQVVKVTNVDNENLNVSISNQISGYATNEELQKFTNVVSFNENQSMWVVVDPTTTLPVSVSGVVDISGHVDISGQTVKTDISGQRVDISGQTVKTDISGQRVDISGQTVDISGQTVNIGSMPSINVDISGQTVKTDISGQRVDISGETVKSILYADNGSTNAELTMTGTKLNVYDASSNSVLSQLSFASGTNNLNTNITNSSLSAYIATDGNNPTKLLTTGSGKLNVYSTDYFNINPIVGQSVSVSSLPSVNVNNLTTCNTSDISGHVDISGQRVDISGQTVITDISGQRVITDISGQTVITDISGQRVDISGETVNANILNSSIDTHIYGVGSGNSQHQLSCDSQGILNVNLHSQGTDITNTSGALNVNVSNTVPVSGTVSVSGGATSANQTSEITMLTNIHNDVSGLASSTYNLNRLTVYDASANEQLIKLKFDANSSLYTMPKAAAPVYSSGGSTANSYIFSGAGTSTTLFDLNSIITSNLVKSFILVGSVNGVASIVNYEWQVSNDGSNWWSLYSSADGVLAASQTKLKSWSCSNNPPFRYIRILNAYAGAITYYASVMFSY